MTSMAKEKGLLMACLNDDIDESMLKYTISFKNTVRGESTLIDFQMIDK